MHNYLSDAAFRIGNYHLKSGEVCQDFALSGKTPLPFAIISDGCSSSGQTDVGARLVCYAAQKTLRYGIQPLSREFLSCFLTELSLMKLALSVDILDLDATLGIIATQPDSSIQAYLAGDGVIVASCVGETHAWVVEWVGSLPGYPSYYLSDQRKNLFLDQSYKFSLENNWNQSLRVSHWLVEDQETVLIEQYEKSAEDGLKGTLIEFDRVNFPSLCSVSIMSDGALQFNGADWTSVVRKMIAFPDSPKNGFVHRRLNKALEAFHKLGFFADDDFSMASISCCTSTSDL